ncbi:MAG: phosphodiesterase [Alloprevotella sp.]
MNQTHFELLAQTAARLHAETNHLYGGYLPYEFHLRLTASFASRFMHCLAVDEATEETILAAAFFHDAIEDARVTYNDLKKLLTRLCDEHHLLLNPTEAADIVYALTNDKGRTRAERAGAAYYAGIRQTPWAPYLKMCDRLANMTYSTLWHPVQRMAHVYVEEMPHFLQEIGDVPQPMIDEALHLSRLAE